MADPNTPDYGLNTDVKQKYYCTLRFQEYSRPKPFSTTTFQDTFKYILPLPQTINDNVTASWTNANLDVVGDIINGSIEGAAASALYRNIGTAGNALATAGTEGLGTLLSKGSETFADTVAGITSAVSKTLPAEQIQNAAEAAFGVAANPNATLMFKGPELRQFSFRWIFYPKNQTESDKIHQMIRNIKKVMLPEVKIAQSASLLKYPQMCLINFYPWDGMGNSDMLGHTAESIIIIKRCAVTACNVNYTPGVTPNFFAGDKNRPTIIEMSLTLNELEYVTSGDWGSQTYGDKDLVGGRLAKEVTGNGVGIPAGQPQPGGDPKLPATQ